MFREPPNQHMVMIGSLTSREETAVNTFLLHLQQQLGGVVQKTTLFGSKARGDSEADSDIDILILVDEENWTLRDKISLLASRVSLNYDVLLGTQVVGQQRWQQMKQDDFSLCKNIEREGVALSFP